MKGYKRVPTPDDPEVSGCSLCAFKNGAPECTKADCWPDEGSEIGYYFKKKGPKVFKIGNVEYVRVKVPKETCIGCAFAADAAACLSGPRCTPKEGKAFIFKKKED